MSKHTRKTLQDLTWTDLENWAGSKIVSRGMSYQKSKTVRDLAVTHEGGIIAWVRGSENYVTMVSHDKERLSSVCTCPYGATCKHAVAVVLEYLDLLQKNADVPLTDEDDERILLLEDASLAMDDDEDDIDYEEDDDFITDTGYSAAGVGIDSFLKKKSRKELQAMLSGILKDNPKIKKELGMTTLAPGKKGCAALVKAVTKNIVITSSEQGWRDYWKHTGHTPDYSSVRKGLNQLIDEGCLDDVVRLGEKLFVKGIEQVEQSNDEGETAEEIAEALSIVFQALAKCSLTDPDKLERAVDFVLRDEYGLCRGLDAFRQRKFSKKTWGELADRLLERLRDMQTETQEDSFYRNYKRDRLSDEVILALKNAGREEESITICFQEAESTGSYERLVRKLRKAGRAMEVEVWIRKGVKATQDKWPGISSSLKKELLDIRQRKRDWLFVAALHADDFFNDPCLKTYKDLRSACEKAKVWREVREACLRFLETGVCPSGKAGWPLHDTGFRKPEKSRRGKPPFIDILIDIAIEEKRVDDVLLWYDANKQRTTAWRDTHQDDEVATAIAHKYPDKVIAIWKEIAEGLIAQTNVGAYSDSMAYLKKVHKTLDGHGRTAEWADYLKKLTETHKRKSRLIQMLNVLSRRLILSK